MIRLKRLIIFVLLFVLTICIDFGEFQVYAHEAKLDIGYDACIADVNDDSAEEMWYKLSNSSSCWHLDHTILTIRYYFENISDYEGSDIPINEIKDAYVNSMKKWNNVYYYSYDSAGNVVKNKIINIVEGSYSDHNLSIFLLTGSGDFAVTANEDAEDVETGDIAHRHCANWEMDVYIDHYYVHDNRSYEYVEAAREKVGAHEIGHVLGLRDIDSYCSPEVIGAHHLELIMGGGNIYNCTHDITYKDIAGVAITRNFHTDDDHKWLNCGLQIDGTIKLICTFCNGVKYFDPPIAIQYDNYGACDNEHDLTDGNMIAVASYQNKDYYKCKYCRYVAPFEDRVEQDYSVTILDNTYHQYENNVPGLEYTFKEIHNANRYVYLNGSLHQGTCLCGKVLTVTHSVRYEDIVDGRYAICLGCRTRLDLTKDNANITYGTSNLRTANGSYVLPNGIVVLVEADLEAYDNGTLQFYNVDDQTQTE
ncbi:MAG: hypothetical protein E7594_04270 [Ruminococcaceae bacterium]|nr:hypothetical protein [Oscillospiraceae bacterium]